MAHFRPALKGFLDLRLGSLAGWSAVLMSLPLYRSFESRPVLNRWSYAFAGFALIAVLVWVGLLIRCMLRRSRRSLAGQSTPAMILVDGAIFLWGIGYLAAALHDADNAARILDFNFVGSIQPLAAVFEWVAVVFVLTATVIALTPRMKRRRGELILAAAALGALFLLFEGVARVKALLFPAVQGLPTNSTRIWMQRHAQLNREGFRDGDHAVESANGLKRLLVIGDSYAFGTGIADPDARFGERVASHLSTATGQSWESINASRADTHTIDHQGFLQQTLVYRPDLVILLYVFNDIDYLRPVTQRGPLTDLGSSPFSRLHPGRLAFLNSYAVQETAARWRHVGLQRVQRMDPYADTVVVNRHLQDVKALADSALRSGARVGVVPFDLAVLTEPAARARHEQFVRLANIAGIPVWPIDSAFGDEPYRSLIVNKLDHHPNERAHDLAARAAVRSLLNQLQNGTAAVAPAFRSDP